MKYVISVLLTLFAGTSLSASDTMRYEVTRSVTVDAPADVVWNTIGDFCDLDDWHPAVTSCVLKSPEKGVHRIVTVEGAGDFLEKLVAQEPGLSYTYSILETPLPLERYTGTLSIERGDSVTVTWSSRFKSSDPAMEAVVGGLYDAGLASLKDTLEQ